MDISDFDYHLPPELIAQHPVAERDTSRLLIADRASGRIEESTVAQIGRFLRPGDALVLNETFVHPARLLARKNETGARIELLLLQRRGGDRWEAMAQRVSRLREGTRLVIAPGFEARVISILGDGNVEVEFDYEGEWEALLNEHGRVPLPPYIQRTADDDRSEDRSRYQTVYAKQDSARPSAAAPTAGLHFTGTLLDGIREAGVRVIPVRLQVGRDTFLPIRVESLDEHRMHYEWFEMPESTAAALNEVRAGGGRAVAVGTTAVRVLESCTDEDGQVRAKDGTTDLFIQPGYRYRCVDGLLTNFHLPRSTLIVLVAAFCGVDLQRHIYRQAVERHFRFYSYGDAMLVL